MKNLKAIFGKNRWLLLILIVALALRLAGINTRPIWYDEAFSLLFSEKGVSAMISGTLSPDLSGNASDIHPLGYYSFLWAWLNMFGKNILSARLCSVTIGLLTVILAYLLGMSLFNDHSFGLLGALGVALSPFHIHYSQEIRMYALMALLLIFATYCVWSGLRSKKIVWWILFGLSATLAQYTHHLSIFYLIPLAMTPFILRRWDKAILTVLAGLSATILYLPWLINLPAQFSKVQNAYWVQKPTIVSIINLMLSYVTNLPIFEPWISLGLTITLISIGIAAYQTYLAKKYSLNGANKGLWLMYLAFVPVIFLFIVSQWVPVFIERALLPSGVMFWLWIVWAFNRTDLPRILRFFCNGLLAIGIILGIGMHISYREFPYGPYEELTASLRSRSQPTDVIIHSNKLTFLPSFYFDPALKQQFIADPPNSSTDTLANATQRILGIQASPSLEKAIKKSQRIWFIIFKKSIEEANETGLDTHPHLSWLDNYYQFQNIEEWGPIFIYVYNH